MTHPIGLPCIVCDGTRWTNLPDPGPQSMASDWRVIAEPLSRRVCDTCGLARRQTSRAADALYASGYGLYAHAPGQARERSRQEAYARWIAGASPRVPTQVLDVGCGNGSLLHALRSEWPHAGLLGCDPSEEAIAHGADEGLRLWRGTAGDLPADAASDLVTAVNVIEHTPDPLGFLLTLRQALVPGGHLVLVCPDGGRPGLELLFADHLFSFARAHLEALFPRAGLEVVTMSLAPRVLGAFQMVVGRGSGISTGRGAFVTAQVDGRHAYLDRWRGLDDHLQSRMRAPAVCFGAGEAAGLLRAYAPRAWTLVRACTVDGQGAGAFGALPVIPLDAVRADETVLVGVRPDDQPEVARRLGARFSRVVTWYDLVDGEQRV